MLLQSNPDYPDLLRPDNVVWIIESLDNRNVNINEQN